MWYTSIRTSQVYHGTPSADKILKNGFSMEIPEEYFSGHFESFYYYLPEESQEKIKSFVENSGDSLADDIRYWAAIEGVVDLLINEWGKYYPNAQIIWSTGFPSKIQMESYGPDLLEVDTSDMNLLHELYDELGEKAYIYIPEEGQTSIPSEYFKQIKDIPYFIEYGYDREEDE